MKLNILFFLLLLSQNVLAQKPKWLIEKENEWKKGFSQAKIQCFDEYAELSRENSRDASRYNCSSNTGSGKGPCWESYRKAQLKNQKCSQMKQAR